VDPKARLSVDQMLAHPWVALTVSDKDLTPALSELRKFNARRKLRAGAKAALAAAAFTRIVRKLAEAAAENERIKAAEAAAAAGGEGVVSATGEPQIEKPIIETPITKDEVPEKIDVSLDEAQVIAATE